MVFYDAFNNISVISWQQLKLFLSFLGFPNTRDYEVYCPRTSPWLEPRTRDKETITLPLSHAGRNKRKRQTALDIYYLGQLT